MTSWPWMTLMWHKITKGLVGCVELSQIRSMSFNRLYFNLALLLCPAKPAMTENKKWPLTRPVTSSVTFRPNFAKYSKVQAGSYKSPFRIQNRSSSLADSRGSEVEPSPSSHWRAGSGNTPSGSGMKGIMKIISIFVLLYLCHATPFSSGHHEHKRYQRNKEKHNGAESITVQALLQP